MQKNTNYLLTVNNCPSCASLKNKLKELGIEYVEYNMSIPEQRKLADQLLLDLAMTMILRGGIPILICVDDLGYAPRVIQHNQPIGELKKKLGVKK